MFKYQINLDLSADAYESPITVPFSDREKMNTPRDISLQIQGKIWILMNMYLAHYFRKYIATVQSTAAKWIIGNAFSITNSRLAERRNTGKQFPDNIEVT
jgi:hypothetical protein